MTDDISTRLQRIEDLLRASQPTQYLDTHEVADITGISTVTLERWRTEGEGPVYVKLSRAVRYRRVDVDRFMAERIVAPLSATPSAVR